MNIYFRQECEKALYKSICTGPAFYSVTYLYLPLCRVDLQSQVFSCTVQFM